MVPIMMRQVVEPSQVLHHKDTFQSKWIFYSSKNRLSWLLYLKKGTLMRRNLVDRQPCLPNYNMLPYLFNFRLNKETLTRAGFLFLFLLHRCRLYLLNRRILLDGISERVVSAHCITICNVVMNWHCTTLHLLTRSSINTRLEANWNNRIHRQQSESTSVLVVSE